MPGRESIRVMSRSNPTAGVTGWWSACTSGPRPAAGRSGRHRTATARRRGRRPARRRPGGRPSASAPGWSGRRCPRVTSVPGIFVVCAHESLPRSSCGPATPRTRHHRPTAASVEHDGHHIRRPAPVASRRGAGRADPAAPGPRRARTVRRLRAGRARPVPRLGRPLPGRAGRVHPADPRRGPAHPGPGDRADLGRRHPRPWPPRAADERRPGGRSTGSAPGSCCTARRTRCRWSARWTR